jgi:hypothetical protein
MVAERNRGDAGHTLDTLLCTGGIASPDANLSGLPDNESH